MIKKFEKPSINDSDGVLLWKTANGVANIIKYLNEKENGARNEEEPELEKDTKKESLENMAFMKDVSGEAVDICKEIATVGEMFSLNSAYMAALIQRARRVASHFEVDISKNNIS
jgi:hypothetical protein